MNREPSRPLEVDAVIWDWNGTLMDDVQVCVAAINVVLDRRGMERLTLERYLDVFCFPVEEYYKAIGFDFSQESFRVAGREFVEEYERRWNECPLQSGVEPVLQAFAKAGKRQFVLSAAESDMLRRLIAHYQIGSYFSDTAGLGHIYASSKLVIGRELIARAGIDPARTVMVGDTSHDADVARELGVRPILVSRGHQSAARLRSTGEMVVENVSELLNHLAIALD